MANKIVTSTIKHRQGTAAEWENKNLVLAAGEFGFDTTNKVTKIGDGVTAWKNLPTFITTKFSFGAASWTEIAELSEAGKADKYFAVGEEKTIALTTGEQVTLVILGFNHDDLSSGGKAGITIGMKELLATRYVMNSSETSAGGWDASKMRTDTMSTLLGQLPTDLRNVIKTVNKKASEGEESATIKISADKLFLFSQVEIDGKTTATCKDEGTQYEYWRTVKNGTVAADRIKKLSNGGGSARDWWLRSPHIALSSGFVYIDSTGSIGGYGALAPCGVSFGFCI